MRGARVSLLLVLCACHAPRTPDPVLTARGVLRSAATAIRERDDRALDREVVHAVAAELARALDPAERAELARRLEAAAAGRGRAYARVQVTGPLSSEVTLEHDREGWRVDPSSAQLVLPTPLAAVERLIAALERLQSDPALGLLSRSLGGLVGTAVADRIRGLREVLPRVPVEVNGRLPLQIDYGQGFFVVLRSEDGGWHVDDFN